MKWAGLKVNREHDFGNTPTLPLLQRRILIEPSSLWPGAGATILFRLHELLDGKLRSLEANPKHQQNRSRL